MLRVGGAGLSAGLAGCSAVRGLMSDPRELLLTLWNFDQTQSHDVLLRVIEADADTVEGGQVLREEFTLARAADTAAGEEFDEGSRKDARVESRPYLVRVHLSPSAYGPATAHDHFQPCRSEDLDRMQIHFVRDEAADELSVRFESPPC